MILVMDKTRTFADLDRLLDMVKPREREVTIDVRDCTPEQREDIIHAATARGLHVAGSRNHLLIRDLRGMHLTGAS